MSAVLERQFRVPLGVRLSVSPLELELELSSTTASPTFGFTDSGESARLLNELSILLPVRLWVLPSTKLFRRFFKASLPPCVTDPGGSARFEHEFCILQPVQLWVTPYNAPWAPVCQLALNTSPVSGGEFDSRWRRILLFCFLGP